jgi:hypothetical protein
MMLQEMHDEFWRKMHEPDQYDSVSWMDAIKVLAFQINLMGWVIFLATR